ncbi:glycosyltransferase family 61 protein [Brucella tritici]|uniref:glycosyltransferase family 61 protein n=1 Tax=Brucella tritici TaxID=94626 RepID=UPI00200072FF|nr:glycosyltransferase family 61 protein [Brucella tritici]
MKRLPYRIAKSLLRQLRFMRFRYEHFDDSAISTVNDPFVSQCFDAAWYSKKYLADINEGEDAWAHYLHTGWRLNFDPCEFFWGKWYLERNPDVAAASVNPLLHFERHGAAEFRNPSPLFDTQWYTRTYNIDPKIQNPLSHFLSKGRRLGYAPRADQVVSSFMRGTNYGGHASILLDRIEWKLEHAGQSALHQGTVCTARAYHTGKNLEIVEQPFLEEIAREMRKQNIVYAEPPYSVVMENVVIIPGSTSLVKETFIINDEIANSPVTSSLKLWDRTWRRDNNILLQYTVGLNPTIKMGIHLFKEYEQNYFHFVTEVLPKLMCYERLCLDVSIPLLISSDLDNRLYELIDLFKNPQRKVLKLERDVPYLVEKLFYISDLSLVRDVYDRRPIASDTYLSERLLNSIAEQALKGRDFSSNARRRRKLFLTRDGKRRKIVNESELVDALISRDFEIVDLNILSVKSQIELFSSAEVIVGGTGASFTNLLWCRPDTKAVILYPDHPFSNTTFWDRIGVARKLNIEYINGTRMNVLTGMHSMHDDFKIIPQQVVSVL